MEIHFYWLCFYSQPKTKCSFSILHLRCHLPILCDAFSWRAQMWIVCLKAGCLVYVVRDWILDFVETKRISPKCDSFEWIIWKMWFIWWRNQFAWLLCNVIMTATNTLTTFHAHGTSFTSNHCDKHITISLGMCIPNEMKWNAWKSRLCS